MMRQTLALLACLATTSTLTGSELYRFGPLGLQLPTEDIVAIRSVAVPHGEPWALFGWYSQVLPEKRYVDVFLFPTASTERLRRGRVLHLECSPIADEPACVHWKEVSSLGQYAQVADGEASFSDTLLPRTPRERPIRVGGDFSNTDLLTLVSYIRSSPRRRNEDGSVFMAISGETPIQDIQRQADGAARVWLSLTSGVAQSAILVQTPDGWRVTEVVMGVA